MGTDLAETAAARTWARQALPGLLDHPAGAELADDVELLLSELCTNAVRHGGGLEAVHLQCTANSLRVTVLDEGVGTPARADAGTDLDHGRGLVLVEAIATAWGVDAHPGNGKGVWFELPLSDLEGPAHETP